MDTFYAVIFAIQVIFSVNFPYLLKFFIDYSEVHSESSPASKIKFLLNIVTDLTEFFAILGHFIKALF